MRPQSVGRGRETDHLKHVEEYEALLNHLDVTEAKVHRHHVPPYMDQYYYCTERHKELPKAHILTD